MQEEKKERLIQIMNELNEFVNQDIIIIYWQRGKLNGLKGKMMGIEPFDYIKLDDIEISFAGIDTAIQLVASGDEGLLYYNPEVEHYQGFSFKNIMGLITAQEELLGYSVKREEVINDSPRGM